MKEFRVTEDRKVFLDGQEVKNVLGFRVDANAGESPEVALRVPVEKIVIEGYTDICSDKRDCGYDLS